MRPEYEARLTADGVTFDARDARLLRAIDTHGSLNAAASDLGRSYARAHTRLTELEDAFGSLVERQRGGPDGGGSTLTDDAHDLLAAFERLEAGYESIARSEEHVLEGRVVGRDGELATVETAAGTVQALVPPDATEVAVTLRSDAVTLHAPSEAPPADATSARNRLQGTVVGVDAGTAVARVRVDIGSDAPLVALVTTESVDRLVLEAGQAVVVSFKATATRGTPQ
ncbi:TOBE domain-containing protein [Halorarius litoreus]|uniref:TOBE domain-containing protein n=1 Tax=Halorarius litoreus TaxID=2962676 RepID=UPI0020CF51EA|nr:TOBE domain-containing protein [Halorarius litoreus]